MNPIKNAVEPFKTHAQDRAESYARHVVENVKAALEKAGHDMKVAAPHPTGNMGRAAYAAAEAKYILFTALVKYRECVGMPGKPSYADVDSVKVDRFIAEARKDAGYQYDKFVAKLVAKIGPCESASITGNHVWDFSILTVTKEGGVKENWKTTQIENVSKLGKYFPQWPTRKIK